MSFKSSNVFITGKYPSLVAYELTLVYKVSINPVDLYYRQLVSTTGYPQGTGVLALCLLLICEVGLHSSSTQS